MAKVLTRRKSLRQSKYLGGLSRNSEIFEVLGPFDFNSLSDRVTTLAQSNQQAYFNCDVAAIASLPCGSRFQPRHYSPISSGGFTREVCGRRNSALWMT